MVKLFGGEERKRNSFRITETVRSTGYVGWMGKMAALFNVLHMLASYLSLNLVISLEKLLLFVLVCCRRYQTANIARHHIVMVVNQQVAICKYVSFQFHEASSIFPSADQIH